MYDDIPTDLPLDEFKQMFADAGGNPKHAFNIYRPLFRAPEDSRWPVLLRYMSQMIDRYEEQLEKVDSLELSIRKMQVNIDDHWSLILDLRNTILGASVAIGSLPSHYRTLGPMPQVFDAKTALDNMVSVVDWAINRHREGVIFYISPKSARDFASNDES